MPPIDPALLLLRPRQVALLANSAMEKLPKSPTLTSDQKALLVRSVARFLQSNGFSKTLKKFLSEAHVTQTDDLNGNVELEEIFVKYINNACDNGMAQQSTHPTGQETKVLNGKLKKSEKQTDEPGTNEKEKTKKKKKDASSDPELVPDSTVVEKPKVVNVEEKIKKKKNDMKKDTILNGSATTVDSKILEPETMVDDSKRSKKRKRTVSDENELKPAEKIEIEESLGSHENNEKVKQCDDLENGNVDKTAEKFGTQKGTKKQGKGSAEPKTAFQRVKVEEVVFTDDRLKNNSYWAKGGADTGYGAKAEEVLGQVRGRDFRHEKTKKKRGSYRGGQIDLQSHSVKFNYSDEE